MSKDLAIVTVDKDFGTINFRFVLWREVELNICR